MPPFTFDGMMTKEPLLTIREAAEAAGLTVDGLNKAIQSGRIRRIVKIGHRNHFFKSDMVEYRQRREARRNGR